MLERGSKIDPQLKTVVSQSYPHSTWRCVFVVGYVDLCYLLYNYSHTTQVSLEQILQTILAGNKFRTIRDIASELGVTIDQVCLVLESPSKTTNTLQVRWAMIELSTHELVGERAREMIQNELEVCLVGTYGREAEGREMRWRGDAER